jgi:hypothetical protein
MCLFREKEKICSILSSLHHAANGTGIYAVVAFAVPSVLVKDIKLN